MKKPLVLETFGTYAAIFALGLATLLLMTGFRSCGKSVFTGRIPGGHPSAAPHLPSNGGGSSGIATLTLARAPEYVRRMVDHLKKIRNFQPPKGFRGGRIFRNREGKLPNGRTYYEYDVHPMQPGISRSAERLIVDQEKRVFYYTRDHYNSFIKIE